MRMFLEEYPDKVCSPTHFSFVVITTYESQETIYYSVGI
jgi:hypothetical protein